MLGQASVPQLRPTFEAASVKPVMPGSARYISGTGGRFIATGQSLNALIMYAYGLRDYQVIGGPKWADSDLWEIQATGGATETPRVATSPALNATNFMLQSLLEDRFGLQSHVETRPLPSYELVVAKGGPRVKLSKQQSPPQDESDVPLELRSSWGSMRIRPGHITGTAIPISFLTTMLAATVNRPIIDKTELQGFYDVDLTWTPDRSPGVGPAGATFEAPGALTDIGATSFMTAIEQQLGFQVKVTRTPQPILLIDNARRPDPN
jgi:uncharacterized protein (TIGR03435 family)